MRFVVPLLATAFESYGMSTCFPPKVHEMIRLTSSRRENEEEGDDVHFYHDIVRSLLTVRIGLQFIGEFHTFHLRIVPSGFEWSKIASPK